MPTWTRRCDYEDHAKVGAIMGSGGAIVMDENTCMVDMARFFMEFIQDESCGKCTPCREGTRRLLQLLEKICEGRGSPKISTPGNPVGRHQGNGPVRPRPDRTQPGAIDAALFPA
jgi:hypothetical protein